MKKKKSIDLSIIVPVYDEIEVIDLFYQELKKVISQIRVTYEIIFIDDGSLDGTFNKISEIACNNSNVIGVKLSRNFGHQMALFAGLSESSGNYILMMDGDLQHPPELITELWKYSKSGIDIVYTIREKEKGIGRFKKYSSKLFYKLFNYLSNLELSQNTADFRIISRKVCNEILQMDERDLFLRGIFSWIGFTQKCIEYKANKRVKGKSKYHFIKMLNFSISGITSFSIIPIRLSLILCLFSISFAIFYSIYAIYIKCIVGKAVEGWTSILILMSLFFSGIFVMLGIIGEYIAKIHIETKKRPRYLIDTRINSRIN